MAENTIDKNNHPTQWVERMAFWTFDLEEAVRCLKEDFPIRKIAEELDKAIKNKAEKFGTTEDEIKADLRDKFGTQNVHNWLKGKVKSIDRENAIKIAFALQMTYEEAETFLKKCWLDGFYLRDVRDVIYRHGLKNRWNYDSVAEMVKSFSALNIDNDDPDDSEAPQGEVTKHLSEQASSACSKEDLEKIIEDNQQFFGTFRRRTFKRFMELYDQLKQKWNDIDEADYKNVLARNQVYQNAIKAGYIEVDNEKENQTYRHTISTEELCDVIVRGIPEMKKRSPNKVISDLIAKHIPTRTTMSEIINKYKRNGKIVEVDRKLFILAWLASNDGDIENFIINNPEDDFKEHMTVLNDDYLKKYGMAELDARHPFDWIVMNSIFWAHLLYKGEEHEWSYDIEGRLEAFIEKM